MMKIMLHLQLLVLVLCFVPGALGNFSRYDFPPDFVFGSGSSAYQVEGAAFEDGRTPSTWDTLTHSGCYKGANGDTACDQYHKYKEDVRLMSETNMEAYRFSISWARLIPNGRGTVNPKGLQYYNNLIDELIANGIEPHVTLFHYDLPQALEDEYAGWVSRKIVKDFTAYADECFKAFGDRVLHWTSINEANVFAIGISSSDERTIPQRRCSPPSCPGGISSTESYIAGHHMLLAHSSAVRLYRQKYKSIQHGFVGFSLYTFGFTPYTNTTADLTATQRVYDFYIGWFLNPLMYGDYPDTMKKVVGTRLPNLTQHESNLVNGSLDFIGLNHYMTYYIKDHPSSSKTDSSFFTDVAADLLYLGGGDDTPSGQLIGQPEGLHQILEHFKNVYGNPTIYIHENGKGMRRNGTLNDAARVEYLEAFIGTVLDAIRNGSNTRGYFAWSFLDGLELMGGYEMGFGLYYVDLDDEHFRRYPKLSQNWYSSFLRRRSSQDSATI